MQGVLAKIKNLEATDQDKIDKLARKNGDGEALLGTSQGDKASLVDGYGRCLESWNRSEKVFIDENSIPHCVRERANKRADAHSTCK